MASVPKWLDKMLDKRARAAASFVDADDQIQEWIKRRGLESGQYDLLDSLTALTESVEVNDEIRNLISQL